MARVIDGDTIELQNGESVRYIGIDAPELRRRLGDRWIADPQPFAVEALKENRRLVEGKTVRLEYDRVRRDRFGRLLAYVFTDQLFVNAHLLEGGWARLLVIRPNVLYTRLFRRLERLARRDARGLWGLNLTSIGEIQSAEGVALFLG